MPRSSFGSTPTAAPIARATAPRCSIRRSGAAGPATSCPSRAWPRAGSSRALVRSLGSRDLGHRAARGDLTGFNWADVPAVLRRARVPLQPARGPAAQPPRVPAARRRRAAQRHQGVRPAAEVGCAPMPRAAAARPQPVHGAVRPGARLGRALRPGADARGARPRARRRTTRASCSAAARPVWLTFARRAPHGRPAREEARLVGARLAARDRDRDRRAVGALDRAFTRPGARAGLWFAGASNLAMALGFGRLGR